MADAKEGQQLNFGGQLLTVQPSCEQDSGVWLCVTHAASFPSNLMAESHQEQPTGHLMAWLCHVHGVEAP